MAPLAWANVSVGRPWSVSRTSTRISCLRVDRELEVGVCMSDAVGGQLAGHQLGGVHESRVV